MKQNRLLLILGLAILTGLASCKTNRYIYKSSKPNVPFFGEKGDADASASIGASGVDVQGAYAISDHFAVTGAASLGIGEEQDEEKSIRDSVATVNYHRNDFEIGVGYFVTLNPSKTITFNLYAGGGIGQFKIDEAENNTSYNRNFKVNTSRFYLQPSFNFMPGRYFRFSVYFKPIYLKYGDISTSYTAEEKEYFGFDFIQDKALLYGEFGYDLQVKIPGVSWLYLEQTLSITPWQDDLIGSTRLYNQSVNATVGLSVRLDQLNL